jgi:hypothetical protein
MSTLTETRPQLDRALLTAEGYALADNAIRCARNIGAALEHTKPEDRYGNPDLGIQASLVTAITALEDGDLEEAIRLIRLARHRAETGDW